MFSTSHDLPGTDSVAGGLDTDERAMPQAEPSSLRLPEAVARPEKPPLPLAAAIGPLIAAGAIWAITRSPYALIFAALSPVMAVAGLVDALWQGRRSVGRQRARRREALRTLRAELASAHERERRAWRSSAPSAMHILAIPEGDPGRWRGDVGDVAVTIGIGDAFGETVIAGEPQDAEERALCSGARRVSEAPVIVPVAGGIGIAGPKHLARSFAGGILVQLTNRLPPSRAGVRMEHGEADWVASLPHGATRESVPEIEIVITEAFGRAGSGAPAQGSDDGDRAARSRGRGTVIRIVLCDDVQRIPPQIQTVVQVSRAGHGELLHAPPGVIARRVQTEHIGERAFRHFALALTRHATAVGATGSRGLPAQVGLGDLVQPDAADGLACTIGIGRAGPRVLDLVSEGPHAVIGGTTGSGKSELLTTWVTAMAAERTPQQVTFLLVDFKGGAAFAPLVALPHCVGVITDLDEAAASRAVQSLRAELRRRERLLAEIGAAGIGEAAAGVRPARLVIVVDEFQAMLESLPDLHGVFADIAARGRSLGVHLILCTQRPAGVVRDSLMANCGLRVCLRVHSKADSQAVIGDERAALLAQDKPGRCLIGPAGSAGTVQAAVTSHPEIEAAARQAATVSAPRRPWLDPLPTRLPLEQLLDRARAEDAGHRGTGDSGDGLLLGMDDDPEHQRQGLLWYRPREHGHLLAVGAASSGRSTLLRTIAAQGCSGCSGRSGRSRVLVHWPQGTEECWDAVHRAARSCEIDAIKNPAAAGRAADEPADDGGVDGDADAGVWPEQTVLMIDDLDALLARLDDDYAPAFADALGIVLREGGAQRITVVATAQRVTGAMGTLAGLFAERMLLRIPDRSEFALAGGDTAVFDSRLPAGAAHWRGLRIQIAEQTRADDEAALSGTTGPDLVRIDPAAGSGSVIVSRRPGVLAERLRARHGLEADVVELEAGADSAAAAVTPDPDAARHLDADGDGLEVHEGTRPRIIVADPETWQQAWTAFSSLRSRLPVIFDACVPVDVRMLTRVRTLPPLIEPHRDRVWIADGDGSLSRGTLR